MVAPPTPGTLGSIFQRAVHYFSAVSVFGQPWRILPCRRGHRSAPFIFTHFMHEFPPGPHIRLLGEEHLEVEVAFFLVLCHALQLHHQLLLLKKWKLLNRLPKACLQVTPGCSFLPTKTFKSPVILTRNGTPQGGRRKFPHSAGWRSLGLGRAF